MIKTYSNPYISVSFNKEQCIHSEICIQGLPSVFNLHKRPWINVDADSTDKIIQIVQACPSAALTYQLHNPDAP